MKESRIARSAFPTIARGFFLASLAALLAIGSPLAALEAPEMNGPVNDLALVLSASERDELAQYLNSVNSQTGVQIGVLTVKSLEGDSIESFSIRVAKKWKLGQADKDNGALLVVSVNDRALRIEVGYGLEGELTDMKSGLIIRNVIVPYFKDGDYGAGVIAGAKSIAEVATGNASILEAETSAPAVETDVVGGTFGFIVFILFFVFMIVGSRRRRHGRVGPADILFGMALGSLLSSGRHNHSSWTGRSGGSGFGGFGGGGGGFSGGGGSFGGGGASGGW